MILCRAERGPASEGYWSWRTIDGRTCHYLGTARIPKSQLTWGHTKQPAKEVVVARKSWSDAELEKLITTPIEPQPAPVPPPTKLAPASADAAAVLEQTPQQRIDGAFEAMGIGAKHWIEPYIGPSVTSAAQDGVFAPGAAGGSAVAAVAEDAAATVPLRDGMEIALMLGIIVLIMLLWRGIAATFWTIGRAQ